MFCNLYNRIFLPSVVSCGLSLLFAFSPSVGLAQSAEDEFLFSSLSVSDLTPEQFSSLAAVAPVILGASGSSGNITNDVASILNLLQGIIHTYGSIPNVMNTLPWANYSVPMGAVVGRGMFETFGNSTTPQINQSFLYEIQRALFGRSGVPPSSDALLPFLYRAYSFTNDISSIQNVISGEDNDYNLLQWLSSNYDLNSNVRSIDSYANYIWEMLADSFQVGDSYGAPYSHDAFNVRDYLLEEVYLQYADDAAASRPALQVSDPLTHDALADVIDSLSDVVSAVQSLDSGYNSQSSVNVTNSINFVGGSEISGSQFNLSDIGASMSGYVSAMFTNQIPLSVFAVNTNLYYSLTNFALPNLSGVGQYASNALTSWIPSSTDPSIKLFDSFTYAGYTVPGMLLDLSSPQLSTLQDKCRKFSIFCYALFFLTVGVVRVRSFVENVAQGFSTTHVNGDTSNDPGVNEPPKMDSSYFFG